jgi:hypothetical protein
VTGGNLIIRHLFSARLLAGRCHTQGESVFDNSLKRVGVETNMGDLCSEAHISGLDMLDLSEIQTSKYSRPDELVRYYGRKKFVKCNHLWSHNI